MKSAFQRQSGFSLVELVSVVVLIAILSVFIAPRLIGTSGYDEYVVRDQLISAIRFAQQRAMSDLATDHCYRVSLTAHSYAVELSTNGGSSFDAPLREAIFGDGDAAVAEALENVTLPVFSQRFDGLGNPVGSCGGANSGNRTIAITGNSVLQLCLYSTGYVRAGDCS
jgi:MSHA pilin protein MshC